MSTSGGAFVREIVLPSDEGGARGVVFLTGNFMHKEAQFMQDGLASIGQCFSQITGANLDFIQRAKATVSP